MYTWEIYRRETEKNHPSSQIKVNFVSVEKTIKCLNFLVTSHSHFTYIFMFLYTSPTTLLRLLCHKESYSRRDSVMMNPVDTDVVRQSLCPKFGLVVRLKQEVCISTVKTISLRGRTFMLNE